MKPGLALLAIAMTGAAPPVSPPEPRILTVENRTAQPIFQLYVETVTPNCWCEDVLGDKIIEAGTSLRIDLGDGKSCRYDLVAVMKDGIRISQYNADLCAARKWAVGPDAQARLE